MGSPNYIRLQYKFQDEEPTPRARGNNSKSISILTTLHCRHVETICTKCMSEWSDDYDILPGGGYVSEYAAAVFAHFGRTEPSKVNVTKE